jgi:hypothetical protein
MKPLNFQKYYSFAAYISSPNAKSHKVLSEKWLADWQNSSSYKKHIDSITQDINLNLVVCMSVIDQDEPKNRVSNFIDIYTPQEISLDLAYKIHIDSMHNFFVNYGYIPAYADFNGFIYIEGLHLSLDKKET